MYEHTLSPRIELISKNENVEEIWKCLREGIIIIVEQTLERQSLGIDNNGLMINAVEQQRQETRQERKYCEIQITIR